MNDTTKPSKENDIVTNAYQDYNWQKLKILKKKTQRSRDTIFIVATYMMLAALFQLGTSKSDDKRAFFISLLLSFVFVGIGFLAGKEPFGALIMAVIIYVGLWFVSVALLGPEYSFRGIIGKIIVIVALASGIPHAYEADKIKKELKESGK